MSGHEQFPPREDGVRRVAPDPASWAFVGPRGDTCTLSLSHMEAMSWSCYNACKDMEGPCLIPGIQPGAWGLVHVRTWTVSPTWRRSTTRCLVGNRGHSWRHLDLAICWDSVIFFTSLPTPADASWPRRPRQGVGPGIESKRTTRATSGCQVRPSKSSRSRVMADTPKPTISSSLSVPG